MTTALIRAVYQTKERSRLLRSTLIHSISNQARGKITPPLSDTIKNQTHVTTPFLIIGGGPTGLFLSTLLSSYSVPSLLLEQKNEENLLLHPQAHFLNLRTLEILRHYSNRLYSEVIEAMPDVETWDRFRFGYSVLGRQFGSAVHSVREGGACKSAVPWGGGHLAQNRFCELLLHEARNSAIKSGGAIRLGVEVTNILHDENAFVVHTSDGNTIKTNCVIACDGAHSKVRSGFGIAMEGQQSMQELINVHFRIRPGSFLQQELSRLENAAMLHFVYNEKVIAAFVCHDVAKGEWVCQIPFFAGYQSLPNKDEMKRLLIAGLLSGAPERTRDTALSDVYNDTHTDHIDILSISPWTMSSLVASKYHLPLDNNLHILLAGDSAHAFPPAGGFGMNTGLQDAHNLAWRMALWHRHHHGDHRTDTATTTKNKSLFQKYERERSQIARDNAALSVRNYQRTLRIANIAFAGQDFVNMSALSQQVVKMMDLYAPSFLSNRMKEDVFGSLVQTAMMPLRALRTKGNAYGDVIARKIRDVLNRGDGLPLLFPRYELGFAYESHTHKYRGEWSDTDEYIPMLQVGHRLPHLKMMLDDHSLLDGAFPNLILSEEDGSVSLTDITHQLRKSSNSGPCFSLLIYCTDRSVLTRSSSYSIVYEQLQHFVETIESDVEIDLELVFIHPHLNHGVTLEKHRKELQNRRRTLFLCDTGSSLENLLLQNIPKTNGTGSFSSAVILVRPDGHVAALTPIHGDGDYDDNFFSGLKDSVMKGLNNCIGGIL